MSQARFLDIARFISYEQLISFTSIIVCMDRLLVNKGADKRFSDLIIVKDE